MDSGDSSKKPQWRKGMDTFSIMYQNTDYSRKGIFSGFASHFKSINSAALSAYNDFLHFYQNDFDVYRTTLNKMSKTHQILWLRTR